MQNYQIGCLLCVSPEIIYFTFLPVLASCCDNADIQVDGSFWLTGPESSTGDDAPSTIDCPCMYYVTF